VVGPLEPPRQIRENGTESSVGNLPEKTDALRLETAHVLEEVRAGAGLEDPPSPRPRREPRARIALDGVNEVEAPIEELLSKIIGSPRSRPPQITEDRANAPPQAVVVA
jgi:hypothetical protein